MELSTTRAFAGVFDLRQQTAFAEGARGRLSGALSPHGQVQRLDDGPLSMAWTEPGKAGIARVGSIVCLLDGHVYNLAELAAGMHSAEANDAATVLAHGYSRLGPSLLPRLRGDFALVFWDTGSRSGLIACDQLGARPLFVHDSGTGLAFASEVSDLLRLLPTAPAPDEVAIAHWLLPAPPPAARTFYEGVRALEPATYTRLSGSGFRAVTYWRPTYRRPRRLSAAEASAGVRASLEKAVSRRLGPSGSSAVLLSGGIDSASVAGLATRAADRDRRPRGAYSVTFPGHPEIDEAELIGAVAAHTGLPTTGLRLRSGSAIAGALPYIERWQLPPSSPNLFFLRPLLDRAALDGVGVLLDGEGGDSVFWHAPPLLADRLRAGRLLSAWSLAGRFPEYGTPTTNAARRAHLRQWARSAGGGAERRAPRWLTPELSALAEDRPAPADGGGAAWWRFLVDGILGPGSRMLHDVSRRHAALAGLEPRHPLLDVDLIELALSIPPELAFDRRYNRPVLRHALHDAVPDAVRLRPYKSNFDAVFTKALLGDLPVIERLLLDPNSEVRAFVERSALTAELAAPPDDPAGLRNWAVGIWHLTTVECWLRRRAGAETIPAALMPRLAPTSYTLE